MLGIFRTGDNYEVPTYKLPGDYKFSMLARAVDERANANNKTSVNEIKRALQNNPKLLEAYGVTKQDVEAVFALMREKTPRNIIEKIAQAYRKNESLKTFVRDAVIVGAINAAVVGSLLAAGQPGYAASAVIGISATAASPVAIDVFA